VILTDAGTIDEDLDVGAIRVHQTGSFSRRTEKTGDMLGFVTRRVEGDLGRFKEFIEAKGEATGLAG
jgi:hypothetical protein